MNVVSLAGLVFFVAVGSAHTQSAHAGRGHIPGSDEVSITEKENYFIWNFNT